MTESIKPETGTRQGSWGYVDDVLITNVWPPLARPRPVPRTAVNNSQHGHTLQGPGLVLVL